MHRPDRGATLTEADPLHPSGVSNHLSGLCGALAGGTLDLHFIRSLTFFFFSPDHFPPFFYSSGPDEYFIISKA